jgi:choline-sulfatase
MAICWVKKACDKRCFSLSIPRAPLIIAGPGVARGQTANACFLVDLLPKIVKIGAGSSDMFGMPVDRRSLRPLAQGENGGFSEAIGESCAKMTGHPVFMIRWGDMRYFHCDSDPAQLYDLAKDPRELENLTDHSAYRLIAEGFAQEVVQRWDSAGLRDKVIGTQKN